LIQATHFLKKTLLAQPAGQTKNMMPRDILHLISPHPRPPIAAVCVHLTCLACERHERVEEAILMRKRHGDACDVTAVRQLSHAATPMTAAHRCSAVVLWRRGTLCRCFSAASLLCCAAAVALAAALLLLLLLCCCCCGFRCSLMLFATFL
jgi:hypothetical protein